MHLYKSNTELTKNKETFICPQHNHLILNSRKPSNKQSQDIYYLIRTKAYTLVLTWTLSEANITKCLKRIIVHRNIISNSKLLICNKTIPNTLVIQCQPYEVNAKNVFCYNLFHMFCCILNTCKITIQSGLFICISLF